MQSTLPCHSRARRPAPWPGALDRRGQNKKKQRIPLTGSHLLPRPEKIARVSKHSSPFHRTIAHGRCCALRASPCLGRLGDRQIQIHRDGLPIRPPIARPRACFHPPIAQRLEARVARILLGSVVHRGTIHRYTTYRHATTPITSQSGLRAGGASSLER